MRGRGWSRAAVVGVAMAIGAGTCAAAGPTIQQTYNTIKALESQFPLPQPRAQVNVGTFDVASGQFSGLTSTTQIVTNPVTHKPMRITLPARAPVNAVAITLRFAATNGQATFSVTPTFGNQGPGPTTSVVVPAFQSRTVDVGRAMSVAWKVTAGSLVYSDRLVIERPKIVGVGAFIVPALPVMLVYEPPFGNGVTSSQTYTEEHTVGTAVKMEFEQENSTTTPGSPSKFGTIADLKSQVSGLASVFKAIGQAGSSEANKIGQGLDFVAGALGQATASDTSDTVHTQVSEQELKVTVKRAVTPNSHLGPGKGDVIGVLVNARLVWLVEDGALTLALLGFDSYGTWAVKDLVASPGLFPVDVATIQELLKLDPFVAGGTLAALPGPRFVFDHAESLSNVHVTWGLTHQISQTDLTATAYSQMRTEDYRSGWLSFLGIGVDETKQVTTKMTHSNSTAVSVGSSTTAEITFDVVGTAAFNIFFDRVFGTFAVTRQIHTNPVTNGVFTGGLGTKVLAR